MDKIDQKKSGEIKNGEYKELVDFLALKFDNIDKRFENIDRQFDNIDKKFDNIDKRFENIDKKFDELGARIGRVDARLGTKIDDYHAEQIGMRRQLDKHEKWHFKVAAKVGVVLRED